jgi:branched-subunit amino acid aminotransferase/4-amino-4-deoxychorismate lyase
MSVSRIELNGAAASVDDLRHLILTNYGHFTAMRVEEGGVRGLELHLDRLVAATHELFGTALDRDTVRGHLRHAIAGERELSLRVNVFSRALDRDSLARGVAADVLVIASVARSTTRAALRLKSFDYARDAAALKHVGTFPLFHHRRLAQLAGFDDALFADESGRISEGSIWNIGFIDDRGVTWPQAPQLAGTGMQLLQAGLRREGIASATRVIHLHELSTFRGAFFTNASVPVRPIASIDEHRFDVDAAWFAKLTRCYESNPVQLV